MKKSHLLSAVCAGVVTLLASVTTNAAIVYTLDRTIGAGTVTGFIETDGTIGVLSTANITDWMITLTAPNLQGGSPDVIDFATGSAYIVGTALTASATGLTFDFELSTGGINTFLLGGGGNLWCMESASFGCTALAQGEYIGRDATEPSNTSLFEFSSRTGAIEFAVAAVPVPAAVWLFGSGLLGLVGMARRKRAA